MQVPAGVPAINNILAINRVGFDNFPGPEGSLHGHVSKGDWRITRVKVAFRVGAEFNCPPCFDGRLDVIDIENFQTQGRTHCSATRYRFVGCTNRNVEQRFGFKVECDTSLQVKIVAIDFEKV